MKYQPESSTKRSFGHLLPCAQTSKILSCSGDSVAEQTDDHSAGFLPTKGHIEENLRIIMNFSMRVRVDISVRVRMSKRIDIMINISTAVLPAFSPPRFTSKKTYQIL